MASWNLQDETKRIINQWYLVLGFIVLGGLLGYAVTWFFPTPYRATSELYVGIDITRVNDMSYLIPLAEEEPLNLDDYKNWQLKQLSDILYSDQVLDAALENLREEDPVWDGYSRGDLRREIDIYWYDTGIWRLEVLHRDRDQAQMAVKAWLDAGYQRVSDLLIASEEAARLDAELEINKAANAVLKQRSASLTVFQESTAEWLESYSGLDEDQALLEDPYQELVGIVEGALLDMGELTNGIQEFPVMGADRKEFVDWVQETRSISEHALEVIQNQQEILSLERQELLPLYHQSLDESLGLSANIVLQENSSDVQLVKTRSPGTNTAAGAGFGFLVWFVMFIVQVQGQRDD